MDRQEGDGGVNSLEGKWVEKMEKTVLLPRSPGSHTLHDYMTGRQ